MLEICNHFSHIRIGRSVKWITDPGGLLITDTAESWSYLAICVAIESYIVKIGVTIIFNMEAGMDGL